MNAYQNINSLQGVISRAIIDMLLKLTKLLFFSAIEPQNKLTFNVMIEIINSLTSKLKVKINLQF
jgi:hypothetical protein